MSTDMATREQTVLFGLLAVKLGKVNEQQWEAAAMKTLATDPGADKTVQLEAAKTVSEILVADGTISPHDAATIQGMAAEAIRANQGDALKAINALTTDGDSVHTLASSLFANPHDAVTLVERAGFDPTAKTVAIQAMSFDQKTLATDPSFAKTVATDPSFADTIASQPGDASHANTVMSQPPSAGAAPTVMGSGGPGQMVPGRPRQMTDALPAVPEHEGRYEFVKALSQGGMGQIVIVHDSHLGRDVALKTLLPDRVPGGTRSRTRTGAPSMQILTVPIIARFLQEARIAGQLEHPAIVPAYELGYRPDGTIYYTMQLVKGKPLQDLLKECKTLQDRIKLLPNFLDVCNAIAFAHSRGVIHRDLKPLNVMIGEFGETLTIDWGIAKVKGAQDVHAGEFADRAKAFRGGDTQSTAKTTYGQAMGSPYFMPPEQAAGKIDEVDERADIYALGAILYVYLTGHPPYKEMKVLEFLDKVQSFDPRPIREVAPDAPAELIAICERAMARKREDRYQSALELRDEVEKFIDGGLVAAYTYTFKELFKRWVKRHWKILTTAAIGLVAFTVLAISSYIAIRVQRDIAVYERGRALTELYFADTSLAQRMIDAAQMAAARTFLQEAPAKDRNWEWGHFQQLANTDKMTLEIGGQYVALGPNNTIITGNDRGTISVVDAKTGESKAQLIKTAGYGYAFTTSADGKRAAMNGPTGVFVWDLESQKQLFTQPHELPEGKLFPFGVSLSADGAKVAANEPDNNARVWDVASGQKVIEAPAPLGGAYLNPQGTFAVVAHIDTDQEASFVTLFDCSNGSALKKFDFTDAGSVKDAVFSPDGSVVAFPTDGSLLIFETTNWQQLIPPVSGVYSKPDTVAFSSDGVYLAAGTKNGDVLRINVKDPNAENAALGAATGHTAPVRSVAIATDAGLLLTASEDRTIHVYDLATLKLITIYRGHDKSIFDVAVDSKGMEMASASFDGITKLWDLNKNLDRYFERNNQLPQPVVFAQDKGLVAIGTRQGVVIADAATQTTKRLLPISEGEVKLLAWDPAATRLAVFRKTGTGGAISIYDTTGDGKALAEIPTKGQLGKLAISGDASTVVLESAADGAQAVDLATSNATPVDGALAWATSPRGNLIAITKIAADGKSQRVSVLQLPALGEVGGFDASQYANLLWNADGTKLGVGTQRTDGKEAAGVLMRWDVATKTMLPELTGHGQIVTAYAEQGDAIATGSGDVVKNLILWNAKTNQPAFTLAAHAGPIVTLAFSPDGSRLASGSTDGTFKLWGVSEGRAISTIQSNEVAAAEATMNNVDWYTGFTPDGMTLATISNPALPPVTLHAFPWEEAKFGGTPEDPLQKRIETYKRTLP